MRTKQIWWREQKSWIHNHPKNKGDQRRLHYMLINRDISNLCTSPCQQWWLFGEEPIALHDKSRVLSAWTWNSYDFNYQRNCWVLANICKQYFVFLMLQQLMILMVMNRCVVDVCLRLRSFQRTKLLNQVFWSLLHKYVYITQCDTSLSLDIKTYTSTIGKG